MKRSMSMAGLTLGLLAALACFCGPMEGTALISGSNMTGVAEEAMTAGSPVLPAELVDASQNLCKSTPPAAVASALDYDDEGPNTVVLVVDSLLSGDRDWIDMAWQPDTLSNAQVVACGTITHEHLQDCTDQTETGETGTMELWQYKVNMTLYSLKTGSEIASKEFIPVELSCEVMAATFTGGSKAYDSYVLAEDVKTWMAEQLHQQ